MEQTLPKTIEEATRRYLHHYENNYRGPAHELVRLRSYAEAKIYRLRRKAPKFFEEKLPGLVNQAGSALLSCNTSSHEGTRKFHETHGHFLRILDELTRSQPAGEVNFQTERERAQERDRLVRRQLELRSMIDKLEATEFDIDDIGEDDTDTLYAKTLVELDKLKSEQKRVAIMIAKMEGQEIEEEINFKLSIRDDSSLKNLTTEQIEMLEEQIEKFLREHKQKRNAIYVDKSIIDGMLEKLKLDPVKFTKEDIRGLSKDALDAYRQFYRDLDQKRREEFFDSLLKNKHLKPKEGLILSGPDDIPEELKRELDSIDSRYKRKLDDTFEEFSKRPCPEDLLADGDESDDKDDDEEDNDDEAVVMSIIQNKNLIFDRIKEEPRDDYDNEAPSEDELTVNKEIADSIDDDNISDSQNSTDDIPKQSPILEELDGNSSPDDYQSPMEASEDEADDDDDDCIEVLGIIEPNDKIAKVNLD